MAISDLTDVGQEEGGEEEQGPQETLAERAERLAKQRSTETLAQRAQRLAAQRTAPAPKAPVIPPAAAPPVAPPAAAPTPMQVRSIATPSNPTPHPVPLRDIDESPATASGLRFGQQPTPPSSTTPSTMPFTAQEPPVMPSRIVAAMTPPATPPTSATAAADRYRQKYDRDPSVVATEPGVAARTDTTGVEAVPGGKIIHTQTTPALPEATVTVGRPLRGIAQTVHALASSPEGKQQLDQLIGSPDLKTRIASRIAALSSEKGYTYKPKAPTFADLATDVFLTDAASPFLGGVSEQEKQLKMEEYAKGGGQFENWKANMLGLLAAGGAVAGNTAFAKGLGASETAAQTGEQAVVANNPSLRGLGARAAISAAGGGKAEMAEAVRGLATNGLPQAMRAGALKAVQDIAAANEVHPAIASRIVARAGAALEARGPQLASAARSGAIQGAVGGVVGGATTAMQGGSASDIAKSAATSAGTFATLGTAFGALSSEAQFQAGYHAAARALGESPELTSRIAREKMARTSGEVGPEMDPNSTANIVRTGTPGSAAPAPAAPVTPPTPGAPPTPPPYQPTGKPLPDQGNVVGLGPYAGVKGTIEPIDAVRRRITFEDGTTIEVHKNIVDQFAEGAPATGKSKKTKAAEEKAASLRPPAQERFEDNAAKSLIDALPNNGANGRAPVDAPVRAAADLSTPEVNAIVKQHELGDFIKQRATLNDAIGMPADPETAARAVVDRYRSLVHVKGMAPDDAKKAIADEHTQMAEDKGLPWKNGAPIGRQAVETLGQRAERAMQERSAAPAEPKEVEPKGVKLKVPKSKAMLTVPPDDTPIDEMKEEGARIDGAVSKSEKEYADALKGVSDDELIQTAKNWRDGVGTLSGDVPPPVRAEITRRGLWDKIGAATKEQTTDAQWDEATSDARAHMLKSAGYYGQAAGQMPHRAWRDLPEHVQRQVRERTENANRPKGVAGTITPDVKALLHGESESLASDEEAAPGQDEQDIADRQDLGPKLVGSPMQLGGKKKRPTTIDKEAKNPSVDTLARYFAPGRVVQGYSGYDRVLSFQDGRSKGGSWSVQVERVVKKDGQWVVPDGERPRNHATQPSQKDLLEFLKSEQPAPAAGKKTDYAALTVPQLKDLLDKEQAILERNDTQQATGQWVRQTDEGTAVSGGSLSGGRGKVQGGFTRTRLDAIETELKNRGVSEDEINAHRFHGESIAPKSEIADEPSVDEMPDFDFRTAKFETPKVLDARRQALASPSTHTIDTPERQALRQAIASKEYGAGAKVRGKVFTFWLGLPGSGKSTLAEKEAEHTGALLTDADRAKAQLPEYDRGMGASAVHRESVEIRDMVRERAIQNGDNTIVQTMGLFPENLKKEIEALANAGWTVHLKLADLPGEKAAERSNARFEAGGHFIDPAFILSNEDLPRRTFDALKKLPGVTSYERYDTDVPRGEAPRLAESGTNEQPGSREGRGALPGDRADRGAGVSGSPREGTQAVPQPAPVGSVDGRQRLHGPLSRVDEAPASQDVSGAHVDERGEGRPAAGSQRLRSPGSGARGNRPAGEAQGDAGARGLPEAPAAVSGGAERGAGARDRGSDRAVDSGTGTPGTVDERVAKQDRADRASERDYQLTPDAARAIAAAGPTEKIRRNIAALEALRHITAEGRAATADEQDVLSRYTGWGGHPYLFDPDHSKFAPFGPQLRDLLTPDEWEAARASTKNAHYTSADVIAAVHAIVARLGVEGGRFLEPSMGAGYFLGLTPPERRSAIKWTGVELDHVTGGLARLLYPASDVRVQGFQELEVPDGWFDAALGNVPFGRYQVHDARYNKFKFSIHNYFFRKALDLVRPGGIVAFVTSAHTMDARSTSARDELAKHADLIAAFRLPATAFKGIASTDVTTDLIILQKHSPSLTSSNGHAWQNSVPVEVSGRHDARVHINVNEYFAAHPEHILGELRGDGTMNARHGDEPEMTVAPQGDIAAHLARVVASLPQGIVPDRAPESPTTRQGKKGTAGHADALPLLDPTLVKDRGLTVHDGTIRRRVNGQLVDAEIPKSSVARVTHLIALRDLAKTALDAQLRDTDDATIERTRTALATSYKKFVKAYGPVARETRTESSRLDKNGNAIVTVRRPNLAHFDDPDTALVATLEHYDPDTDKATPADILERRILHPPKPLEHVDNPADALPLVLAEKGRVDMARVAQLTGRSEADAIESLKGLVFEDPANPGQFMVRDEYASGDVKTKLEQAREAAKTNPARWAPHIAALEPVIPADLPPSKIDAMLGARWIPVEDYMQFAREVLGMGQGNVEITYTKAANIGYKVSPDWRAANSVAATNDYGTKRMSGFDLFAKALNLQSPTVYGGTEIIDGVPHTFEDEDGKPKKNPVQTVAAQQKQEAIKDRFEKWIWEDQARTDRVAAKYNREHNRVRNREYDGSHLTLPGTATYIKGRAFAMRQHQLNAIWRIITNGNTLLAHEVGTGKTYTMIAAGMELKRLGLARKPMHVVLKHMIDQYAMEMRQLYPQARVLVATEEDFAAKNRREFLARAAQNDWDAIVIGQTSFEKIPMSEAFQKEQIKRELDELAAAIREAKAKKGDRATIKQIETAKANLEVRLAQMMAEEKKDDLLTFEELGVDMLFVDEADAYKNLQFTTKLEGVATPKAQRSYDMLLKSKYLEQINPGRGLVFATGTPIANAVAEVCTMMRYLQPKTLEGASLHSFDDWAAMFGRATVGVEMKPDGNGFRVKSRFARFGNIGELAQLFRQAWDVQFADDLPDLTRPPIKGNGVQYVETPKTDALADYIRDLGERADDVANGHVAPEVDNMLKITSDGRKAALDMRLVDAGAGDDPNNKINRAVDNIYQIWDRTTPLRGAQLVFGDLYQTGEHGTGLPGFNVYEEVRDKLVARGVPRKEIRFASEAKSDAQKAKLKADVRAGRVRVLIGSTEKMGAGMNVQDRLVALHHLDAPHRPRDVEQRNGRIWRQGNLLHADGKIPYIEIYAYLAEGSFDGYMWQGLERKAGFIKQALNADAGTREIEDLEDVQVDWATAKAIASGNPKVKEKADVDAQLAKLERQAHAYRDAEAAVREELDALPPQIAEASKEAGDYAADAARVVDTMGDHFRVKVNGTEYTERRVAENALAAVVEKARELAAKIDRGESREQKVGTFAGFDLSTYVTRSPDVDTRDVYLTLRGATAHLNHVAPNSSAPSIRMLLEAMPPKIAKQAAKWAEKRDVLKKRLADLQAKGAGGPFPKQQELEQLRDRAKALAAELKASADKEKPSSGRFGERAQAAESEDEIRRRVLERDADQGGPSTGARTDLYSFADPISMAYKMWKDANTLKKARLAQSASIRYIEPPKAKALQRVAEMSRESRDAIYALLVPGSIDADANKAGRVKIAKLGEKAYNDEHARNALLEAHAFMEKLPVDERYAFVDRYERGQPQPTPFMQKLDDAIHRVMDDRADAIKALGKGHLKTFRENYWGRMLVPPTQQGMTTAQQQAFRETMTRRPLQGAKSFAKKRSFEYLSDALAAGYEPITKNPVDWLLLKVREMNRYVAAHEIKNELRAEGLVKFYRPSKRLPEGWGWLDDRIFVAYGPRDATGAQTIRGKYAAPSPVARIINNYLSPGLRGNPLYDGYMFLGNTMNMLQLGFSAFHLGFVAFDATISQGALGLEQLKTKGQRATGAKNVAIATASMALAPFTGIPVLSPALMYRKGSALQKAYKFGTSDVHMERLVEAVTQAGGRIKMDDLYKSDGVQKFRAALRDRRFVGTIMAAPFAAIEGSMKPILEHIVPRLKMGAFYTMAERELAKLPTGATEDDIRRVLQAVWSTIDDRLGQVVYDNYHWHNVTKHVLMGAVRAVGWDRGSISLTVGGAGTALGAPIRAWRLYGVGGAGGGKGGGGGIGRLGSGAGGAEPGRFFNTNGDEVIDHKLAYLIAAASLMAVYGAIYTYLHSGDRPGYRKGKYQGAAFLAKDLYVPRTGTVNLDHSLERMTPATYIKDVIAFGHHPVDTFMHKMQPAIALLSELVFTNKDYFGDDIRNTDDPVLKQAQQDAAAVLKAYMPITASNYMEGKKRGTGTRERLENFVGLAPASRELVRTPAQNLMNHYLGGRMGGLTPEARDLANERSDLRRGLQTGEKTKADVRKLVIAGELTPRQGANVASVTRRDPRLLQFEKLTPEQAVKVFDKANDEEQALFKRVYDARKRQVDRMELRRLRFGGKQ